MFKIYITFMKIISILGNEGKPFLITYFHRFLNEKCWRIRALPSSRRRKELVGASKQLRQLFQTIHFKYFFSVFSFETTHWQQYIEPFNTLMVCLTFSWKGLTTTTINFHYSVHTVVTGNTVRAKSHLRDSITQTWYFISHKF